MITAGSSNKADMISIFKAIKNSSLSESLQTLDIKFCGWEKPEVKQILESDEVGLGHIELKWYYEF